MYSAEINRNHPACLLLLVDHSTSMREPWAGTNSTLAAQLAMAVNRLLENAVMQCTKGSKGVYNYFEVGVIGYGSRVEPVLHGTSPSQPIIPISVVADSPLRVDQVAKRQSDDAGGIVDVSVTIPVWLEPINNGPTPMNQAIEIARQLMEIWCEQHPHSFPPLVVNVTDGESTDKDPRAAAEALRTTGTADGSTLLFNVHLSSAKRNAIEFPASVDGLDRIATQLFEMSSVLPPAMLEAAEAKGYRVDPQARGFLYNAEATHLIDFLDLGTRAVTPGGLRELTAGPSALR